jgi:hypothetical protein
MDAMTNEEAERERQAVTSWVRGMSLDGLRLARARLADLYCEAHEEAAAVFQLRGAIVHAEITRREERTSALARIGTRIAVSLRFVNDGVAIRELTTPPRRLRRAE